ncbi:MAG: AAC(3) family N-acetyltransferase [Gemmatimonadota bacterium]
MPRAPRSLNRLCRQVLPPVLGATDGRRLLRTVAEIVETDRWNSFDRFHQTSDTLARHYEAAGAGVEVTPIQTGDRIGSGRWIIQEVQDVRAASLEVVGPVRQRVADYRDCPWHAIQWTSGTPREGLRCELVIADDVEQLERLPRGSLRGKAVLTRTSARGLMHLLADRGAVAVITDPVVPASRDALAWTKFGWGAVPMEHNAARLAGLVLSANQGDRLRRLHARHGRLTVRVRVEVRKYVGTHEVVSGLVRGADDPQDEVWAIAHSGEPGALDNASGVAASVEIARALEQLIRDGRIRRPRRTIRLLAGYECYGFFGYLEQARRLQAPLAGVCIDTVGARPAVCGGRLEWHSTIPMSAGFVDWIGAAVLRATLRRHSGGYRLRLEPFQSTSDTQIGDPQYGYPCPWITTHHQGPGRGFDAYHSSADTLKLVSGAGLKTCAAAMAAYLYYLADMDSRDVVEVAAGETERLAARLDPRRKRPPREVRYIREAHEESLRRLQRWLWGGDRQEIQQHLAACRRQVATAAAQAVRSERPGRVPADGRRIPRRTAPLAPNTDHVPVALGQRISAARLPQWALFWADGQRDAAAIADALACERAGVLSPGGQGKRAEVEVERVVAYLEALAELGYVVFPKRDEMATRRQLVADLRRLGVSAGMDLMVHSSLSAIGEVEGGAETVVDALLEAVGPGGTLLMPSFNHKAAQVYNPLTTPTVNGAIPDAMWRRPEARRSLHPTHPVAAIGARAEWYVADHLEIGIWEPESPIGKLIHSGGYLLALGTTHNTSTAYHVAERSVPGHCNDPFGNIDRIVRPDGTVEEVWGLAFRGGPCPVPIHKIDETLDRRGLQRRGKVGKADCELALALDLYEVRRQHLRRACPGCRVKPRYREE